MSKAEEAGKLAQELMYAGNNIFSCAPQVIVRIAADCAALEARVKELEGRVTAHIVDRKRSSEEKARLEAELERLKAQEREKVRNEHAEWSQNTFGNVGPVGPLKHLSKEAMEAAAEPGDLSEWADMQFLLWDAQRRARITDEQITRAMVEKLEVNKARAWPEPKEGEPRMHIKVDGEEIAE